MLATFIDVSMDNFIIGAGFVAGGATIFIFAFLGSFLLADASHSVIGGVLAFSAAALLYTGDRRIADGSP